MKGFTKEDIRKLILIKEEQVKYARSTSMIVHLNSEIDSLDALYQNME